jgi:hypothetical protein
MPDISSSLSKREVNARQNTYTKSEIDLKDGAIQAIAEAAQTTADAAEKKNQEQDQLIAELQKSSHTHSNKGVLDKTEQPYTTAERDKLAGLENYTHPTHTAHAKGFYKLASDGEGHITNAEKVTKKDITDLGVPGDDTNTTYKLALPTYTNQKEPPAPILSLIGSDGSESKQSIPYAYTVLENIEYEEFSGYVIGDNYRSIADLAFVIPFPSNFISWRITAILYLETRSSEGKQYYSQYYFEMTESGSSIRRNLGKDEAYSGIFAETKDWGVLDDATYLSNPDRIVKIYRVGVTNEVFNELTGGGCSNSRLIYRTSTKGAIARPVSYYSDISIDASSHARDTDSVYTLTKADVSDVAFTGSYNDLANKPTIPDGSKYLPLAGGVMNGDIDLASNGVDLLVGTQRAAQGTYASAVAGATISTKQTFSSGLPERKSLVGSFLDQNSVWHSIISVRHRNGYNDGVNYGMYLRSLLTSDGSLIWNKQTGAGKWQGERVLLDSTNYSSYAAKSDHTHAMITNSALWVSGANNTAKWCRLGVLVSSGNFSNAVIRVWTGNGANGRADQNASFEIQIKDGWQSTESAAKACGVTVYRINCGSVKVKVIPTAHDTYTVWAYLPWGYWNGNYAVYGKYKSWTSQQLIQSEEPEGTGANTAYYDQAFLTSTVAAAKTLTDSGWVAMTVEGYAKSGTVKYRTYGKQITITGSVVLKSDIATSYPAPQYIASTTFDFSKIVGCSGVGRSSSGVGVYAAVENYNGDNLVCVYALGSKIAAGATLYFTITGLID